MILKHEAVTNVFLYSKNRKMLKIDIHTHIIPSNLNDVLDNFSNNKYLRIKSINKDNAELIKDSKFFRKVQCNCWNIEQRNKDSKISNVDIQVLSTIPALFSYWAKDDECLQLSKFLNNHISDIVKNNPNQYIGLGTIPMQNNDLAIKEMDRCINELNLSGVQIGSNINGINLSEDQFIPIFEHAEKIKCSIFIHPWEMIGTDQMKKYWFPWLIGMPAETSRAISSIIFGGVLERFPNLKIAFAHGGGSFLFTLGRIDHGFKVNPKLCSIDNNIMPSEYLGKIYVDSLVHDYDTLMFLIKKIGCSQIALGTDYPFILGEEIPGELIESLDISDKDKQRMLAGTALEWLGLDEKQYIQSK